MLCERLLKAKSELNKLINKIHSEFPEGGLVLHVEELISILGDKQTEIEDEHAETEKHYQ